jgi:hypothetical protein
MASARVQIRVSEAASYDSLMEIAEGVQRLAELVPPSEHATRGDLLAGIGTAMTACVEAVSVESGRTAG